MMSISLQLPLSLHVPMAGCILLPHWRCGIGMKCVKGAGGIIFPLHSASSVGMLSNVHVSQPLGMLDTTRGHNSLILDLGDMFI